MAAAAAAAATAAKHATPAQKERMILEAASEVGCFAIKHAGVMKNGSLHPTKVLGTHLSCMYVAAYNAELRQPIR